MKQQILKLFNGFFNRNTPEWIGDIKSLSETELPELLMKIPDLTQNEKKKILFWTIIPWHNVCLDYILATALRLRGHEVMVVICDGAPICEFQRKAHDRPSCKNCYKNALMYVKAFDLPFTPLSSIIQKQKTDKIEITTRILEENSVEKLKKFLFMGVSLGKYSQYSIIGYYRYLPDIFDAEQVRIYKQYILTGINNCIASETIIKKFKPDAILTCGGKSSLWAPIFEIAHNHGIKAINWEDAHVFPTSFVFNDIQPAIHFNIHQYWETTKTKPLAPEERKDVRTMMTAWMGGTGRSWDYSDSPQQKEEEIRKEIGLRKDSPLISIFTNLSWDGTIYGVDGAFHDMFDWIYSVIDFVREHGEFDLIIRTHPVEWKLPESMVPLKVSDKIRKKYPDLPGNIHILEGNQINSYVLGHMSDVTMVYVTTLGMELAIQGIRPWIVANAHYSKKGFSVDISSREQMVQVLKGREFNSALSQEEIEFAERYVHLLFFRHFVQMPFFKGHSDSKWKIPSFSQILPGANPTIDDLCACIIGNHPFIDIGRREKKSLENLEP